MIFKKTHENPLVLLNWAHIMVQISPNSCHFQGLWCFSRGVWWIPNGETWRVRRMDTSIETAAQWPWKRPQASWQRHLWMRSFECLHWWQVLSSTAGGMGSKETRHSRMTVEHPPLTSDFLVEHQDFMDCPLPNWIKTWLNYVVDTCRHNTYTYPMIP